MPVNSALPPYPVFPDAAGQPLENGFVYIGQPGFEARSSPKASFFDVALTIPTGTASGAAIRTRAGVPINNSNAPAMFYVDGDYSISVCDRNGVLLYSALNQTLALNVGAAIGPVYWADGNLGAVGGGFAAESNTGFVRSAANQMDISVGGALVQRLTPTGTVFQQPVSGSGFTAGVTAIAQPLDADLTALAGLAYARGDLIRRGASALERLTPTAAGQVVTFNGTDTVFASPSAGPRIIANALIDGSGTFLSNFGFASCTRTSAGNFTFNFSNARANANYVVQVASGRTTADNYAGIGAVYSTTQISVCTYTGGSFADQPRTTVTVFEN